MTKDQAHDVLAEVRRLAEQARQFRPAGGDRAGALADAVDKLAAVVGWLLIRVPDLD
jgi:hypothetical protein